MNRKYSFNKKQRPARWILGIGALVVACSADHEAPQEVASAYAPNLESLRKHPIPSWWEEGKIGIFIHWGPASVPAFSSRSPTVPAGWYHWGLHLGKLSQVADYHLNTYGANVVYDDFFEQFTAERYDPDGWIKLFEEAGARYFVLTTKHHDGFALWPSDVSGRDSGDLGPHRDLVGELVAASRRAGGRVRVGLYYSIPEFFPEAPNPLQTREPWPGWVANGALAGAALFKPKLLEICLKNVPPEECQPFYKGPPVNPFTGERVPYTGAVPMKDYAEDQVRAQLRELVERYQPGLLWCDLGGPEEYFRSNESIAWYYNEASRTIPGGVLVNDRCGDETTHHDFATVEYNGEFVRGEIDPTRRGEVSVPLGFSFFYDKQDKEEDLRSVDELVDIVVKAVSQNQNVLLGVGPLPDGQIPPPQAERLRGVGAWLSINGEAIYGSRPWRQAASGSTHFTLGQDGSLYLIALDWPGDQLQVELSLTLKDDATIVLLGSELAPLPYQYSGNQLTIQMPLRSSVKGDHAFVFRLKGWSDAS